MGGGTHVSAHNNYPSLTLTLSTSSSKDKPQKRRPMANQHPQGCGPSGWTFQCGCGSSPTGHWNWGVGDLGGATFSFESGAGQSPDGGGRGGGGFGNSHGSNGYGGNSNYNNNNQAVHGPPGVAIASDASRRLLQSVSFHGVGARCLNIRAGMEIPDNKPLKFALQYVHGIGRARAAQILSELNMSNKLAMDLTRREVVALDDVLSKYVIGRDLAGLVDRDIKRMKDIQCYRGIRHVDNLPCRGQRTSTNARTRKGSQRVDVAASKKLKK
ncbi:PREDICTED: 30S ribosomal [Prunus dulcis]|uniref:PREDICTED: 30S ribosomal n=1 Tax=Prunus dulcis TaxID=3755 RepID=A0A5E4EGH6_PRUDU|nr:hypothetical protein L3X38_008281 [Prunus dulcis]VVA13681.1 PREDICTED: 30S ribosomal [Prunus dulcis]